jgi:hypothetical protein
VHRVSNLLYLRRWQSNGHFSLFVSIPLPNLSSDTMCTAQRNQVYSSQWHWYILELEELFSVLRMMKKVG